MANYIYGRNPVIAALETRKAKKVFLKDGTNDDKLLTAIKSSGVEIIRVSNDELTKLSKTTKHQGVVALKEEFQYVDLDQIIQASLKKEKPLILMLDEVQDPHNFGAIIRTAAAFSVDGIIIKEYGQVLVNDTVEKAAVGAINHIKIAKVKNLNNAVKKLKENGYWIYASALRDSSDYLSLTYDRPTVLIMGSEGDGISRLLLENSDFVIRIDIDKNVESLNVSVATGIILARMRQ